MVSLGHTRGKKETRRKQKKALFYLPLHSLSVSLFQPARLPPDLSLSLSSSLRRKSPLFYLKEGEKGKAKKRNFFKPSFLSNLLDLVERVVVGLHAGIVGLLEADDDGVQHGAGLVNGNDLAGVVEPVALGAENLNLLEEFFFVRNRKKRRKKVREGVERADKERSGEIVGGRKAARSLSRGIGEKNSTRSSRALRAPLCTPVRSRSQHSPWSRAWGQSGAWGRRGQRRRPERGR